MNTHLIRPAKRIPAPAVEIPLRLLMLDALTSVSRDRKVPVWLIEVAKVSASMAIASIPFVTRYMIDGCMLSQHPAGNIRGLQIILPQVFQILVLYNFLLMFVHAAPLEYHRVNRMLGVVRKLSQPEQQITMGLERCISEEEPRRKFLSAVSSEYKRDGVWRLALSDDHSNILAFASAIRIAMEIGESYKKRLEKTFGVILVAVYALLFYCYVLFDANAVLSTTDWITLWSVTGFGVTLMVPIVAVLVQGLRITKSLDRLTDVVVTYQLGRQFEQRDIQMFEVAVRAIENVKVTRKITLLGFPINGSVAKFLISGVGIVAGVVAARVRRAMS